MFDEDARLKDAFKKAVVDNGMDIISSIEFVDAAQRKSTDFAGKEISTPGKELLKESAYFPFWQAQEENKERVLMVIINLLTSENRKK